MKIRDGFVAREIAGETIVIALGEASKIFNGMIKLNETGSFLWKMLTENADIQALTEALTREYEVSKDDAEKDVQSFVKMLLDAGILEK